MEWITIILTFLQPLLAKCFSQVSSETPKDFLSGYYNASTGKMDSWIVRHSMGQTRRAILKTRRSLSRQERRDFPRYSNSDIYGLTEQQLIEAMNAPDDKLAEVFAAAAALPDDDDD